MPRWEPGTRDRLERAALELYAERGYADVTVQDISTAAGVTKATYFRTFADKREVLFWGQDLLGELLAEGIEHAPEGADIRELLVAALRSLATAFPAERHDLAAVRQAIVAQHADLQERLALKRAVLEDAIAAALRARGVDDAAAVVAAGIARTAYSTAYRSWAHADDPAGFPGLVQQQLTALLAAAQSMVSSHPPERH